MYNPNRFPSGYDELKSFYPVYYFDFDVFEMIELLKTYGWLSDDLEMNIDTVINNQFIERADEPTIARLENFLWIPIDRAKPLSDRKHIVLSFFVGAGKLSASKIRQIIQVFTEGEIKITFAEGTLEITVTRDLCSQFSFIDCLYILQQKIPAHIYLALKDALLPVRLINNNESIFRMLGIQSQFFNRKWKNETSLEGLSDQECCNLILQQVDFGIRFNGTNINMFPLDGKYMLDGSWLLGQSDLETMQNRVRNAGIKFGIAFEPKSECIQMKTLGFCIRFFGSDIAPTLWEMAFSAFEASISVIAQGRVDSPYVEILADPLSNNDLWRLNAFSAVQGFQNKVAVNHKNFSLALCSVKQTYALSGNLKKDSMYRLDGSISLDGTRKLNAKVVEEEI